MKYIRNMFNRQFMIRVLFFFTGMCILALGITLTYKAESLGTSAFDALNMGLSKTFGLTPGDWVFITGVIIIIMNSIVEKQFPKILSAIPVFVIGRFMNVWMKVFEDFQPTSTPLLIVVLAIGVVLIAFGAAMYIMPNFAQSPIDLFTLTIMNKMKWNFGKTKTVVEFTSLLLALLFKGPIWIGTLVTTVVIGPIIQYFLRVLKKPYTTLGKMNSSKG